MIRICLYSGACITRDIPGVIATAVDAGLDAIEWAADIHIGAGDLGTAGNTMIATLKAGLTTSSYATLYRAGSGEDESHAHFDALLETASALYAPNMRIYACAQKTDGLASELRRLGDRAAKRGITLCLSMGRGTCLDRYDSALALLKATGHDFVRLAWEDLPAPRAEAATTALEGMGSLARLIVAHCTGRDGRAHPIAEASAAWGTRLRAIRLAETDPQTGSFVILDAARAEGKPGEESLLADAATLRALAAEAEPAKAR